jgi:H+/Cl- antiporter ClcA
MPHCRGAPRPTAHACSAVHPARRLGPRQWLSTCPVSSRATASWIWLGASTPIVTVASSRALRLLRLLRLLRAPLQERPVSLGSPAGVAGARGSPPPPPRTGSSVGV